EQLRLSVCYWHTFCWNGSDIFGAGTFGRPWHRGPQDQAAATQKLEAAFDFITRLGVPYFCFHDVDVMAEAHTAEEHVRNLAVIGEQMARKMEETGVRLLWGTANLFSHPRYMAGAATNPDPEVFAYAAMQVRHALDLTHRLGGANYVLWGGREGYDCLLNTRLKQELDQYGRFLTMVVEHKHKIGFPGTILIEPKPHEPTKHQYDFDVATVYGFLLRYGLEKEVRLNIEANHATLAGHSFEHEIALAVDLGIFGSLDMNRGDPQNGWDTDQFPNDLRELTVALYYIMRAGGFGNGGINFDAKVRRQSIDPEDLFHGHVGAIDMVARALLCAETLILRGELESFVDARYRGWSSPLGKRILTGELTLSELADYSLRERLAPQPRSGRQEMLENRVSAALG
ncbi:MAG: xylose isomerase, partial [Steroidobacteraceae bacterium]|nr:xylose isomerase [Steroidobacteraceae bacterium]MDW8258042.1 xylose isomerase [Gammaproteobacteria bacterium]